MNDNEREAELEKQRGKLYLQSPNTRETGNRLTSISEELRQIHQRRIGTTVEPTRWGEWRQ